MSVLSPRRRASHSLRLTALGVAAACTLGLAAPSLASMPVVQTSGRPAAAPAASDPDTAKKQVDKQVDKLKEQLEGTSANLQDAYFALRRTQLALPAAQAVLDKAAAVQAKADAHNDEMTVALQVAQANEDRAVDALATTRRNLADNRTRVARFAAQLYQDQGMGQLSVALSATTPEDFASRVAISDTVMDVQNQSLAKLATARAAATAQE
jgi:hypothetical protein